MIIRPYAEEDFEGIKEVIHSVQSSECWPHYYPKGWGSGRIKVELEPMQEYKDPAIFVSEVKGRITGFISGHDLESFIEDEIPHLKSEFAKHGFVRHDVFYQRNLIIHSEHQKGFAGWRLFVNLYEHAIDKGYDGIVVRTPPLNKKGIEFFKRLDYRELFSDDDPDRIYFGMGL